eukprot:4647249-Pleurochrysis_carterae.AAC.1
MASILNLLSALGCSCLCRPRADRIFWEQRYRQMRRVANHTGCKRIEADAPGESKLSTRPAGKG